MYGFVYETINLLNGVKYIGMHKSDVFDSYLGSGKILRRAIKKYGKENFERKILATAETEEELAQLEIYYIELNHACSSKKYYNIHEGGYGGNTIKGYSEEQKEQYKLKMKKSCAKLSKMFKGKKRDKQTCENISCATRKYWKNISDAKRQQFAQIMSNAVMGTKNPNYGNHWNKKQKQVQSEKMKGRLVGEKNGMFGHKNENALNGKIVYMYDEKMNLIKIFNTKQMVLDYLGLKGHTQLNNAIKSGIPYKGYIFKMELKEV